jgi:hypothetical protein
MKDVLCVTPLKPTVEPATNPLPLIVSTSGLDPAVAEDGERLVIEG